MQYFKDCKNLEDIRKTYRKLAKKLHPDAGGATNEMAELNRQYETEQDNLVKKNSNKFSKWSAEDKEDMFQKGQQEFYRQYGGYGGFGDFSYKDPNAEYYKQRNNPQYAEYMKMKSNFDGICNALHSERSANIYLKDKIEKLEKKVKRLEKKLKEYQGKS
jgi:curved DNA-binding protein CbpA